MKNRSKVIGGILIGAGLMYLFDPDRGARRRALVRDQAIRARHKLGDRLDATARDLGHRAKGAAAELRARFRQEAVDDMVLHERIRSAIGRVTSHPGAITVNVANGQVTLEGAVLAEEAAAVVRTVRRVRGVSEVTDALQVYETADGVSSLQGGRAGAHATSNGADASR